MAMLSVLSLLAVDIRTYECRVCILSGLWYYKQDFVLKNCRSGSNLDADGIDVV